MISGNIGNIGNSTYVPLDIVSGNVLQTGNYNLALASLSLVSETSFVNEFAGTITLGGDVINDGLIRLNANGTGCQNDSILLRSSSVTQRNWNGSGIFQIVDTDVSGQAGTPIITVYNGTNSGNNGSNWVFDDNCIAPPTASVTIGGRVLTNAGRGISNVRVVMTDFEGITHVTQTNPFGYYRFNEVAVGQTVVITVNSKRFVFANPTQILNVSEGLSEINFTALER